MLDPKKIKEDPQTIREMLKARSIEFDLDRLIDLDHKRRELITKTDDLRKRRNQVALEISQKKKEGKSIEESLVEMKKVSDNLASLESEQESVNGEYSKLMLIMPNLIHKSVPIGPDETANVQIRKWGEIPNFDFKINDHIDVSENLDLVDLERAAKVAGARFYYLKNDLVRLNQSLIHFALDFLSEKRVFINSATIYDKQKIDGRCNYCRRFPRSDLQS